MWPDRMMIRSGVVLVLACLPLIILAHGAAEQSIDLELVPTRLFTADAETGMVIAINLPAGEVIGRLSTPPFVMLLGLSSDRRHLFAMRGRNSTRDWVTVIDTGFDAATRMMRRPHIARTILANKPAGAFGGMLTTVGGHIGLFMEGSGELHVFMGDNFSSPDTLNVHKYTLAAPDHYHYLEDDQYLYIGHFRNGLLQILDREDGRELKRLTDCPGLHGMARDEATGRLFFACRPDVMVVGTRGAEAQREVARIAYPERRLGAMLHGKDRVIWGYDEGEMPALYRLDAARLPYAFDRLPVDASIQQHVSDDKRHLLVLTRAGELQIRDGWSGALIRTVDIATPFKPDVRENTDKAVLPDIASEGGRAYISLPHEGQIAEVDLDRGSVLRYMQTGGQPTRVVLLKATADYADGPSPPRWYNPEDVEQGRAIFDVHCAGCHGRFAQGHPDWGHEISLEVSIAPPLNGTGHTYKHTFENLLDTVRNGSKPPAIGMPGFEDTLAEPEQRAVVAYFQSLWPSPVYIAWQMIAVRQHPKH